MTIKNLELLKSISDIFYGTTSLPITVLSEFGEIIYELTPTFSINKLINTEEIISKLEPHIFEEKNKEVEFIHLSNGGKLALSFIHHSNLFHNYFIIGPYKESKNSNLSFTTNENYIYKTQLCVQYSLKILLSIIEDKLNQTPSHHLLPLNLNIKKAISYIEINYENDITIDSISNELNINKCYFCTLFKKETGTTFSSYLNKIRIDKSKELLKNSNLSILDIAITVGFNNQNYFAMAFKKELGLTPLKYRKYNSIIKS